MLSNHHYCHMPMSVEVSIPRTVVKGSSTVVVSLIDIGTRFCREYRRVAA